MKYKNTKHKIKYLYDKYYENLNKLKEKNNKKTHKATKDNISERIIIYESDFENIETLHISERKDKFMVKTTYNSDVKFPWQDFYVEGRELDYVNVLSQYWAHTYFTNNYGIDINVWRGSHNTEDNIQVYIMSKELSYTIEDLPEDFLDYIETAIVLDRNINVNFGHKDRYYEEGNTYGNACPVMEIKQTEAQEDAGTVDVIVKHGFCKVINTLDNPSFSYSDFRVKMIVSLINPL